jgi:hypothetical protein
MIASPTTVREGLHQESIDTTGAILAGRDGGDRRPGQVQVTIPACPGQWPPQPKTTYSAWRATVSG